MSGNGPVCSICTDPQRPKIDAELVAGRSVRQTAAMFGCSLSALHRHGRNGHHDASAIAPQDANGQALGPTLSPAASAALREVRGLVKDARAHLREVRKGDDPKATNGAIMATNKAMELSARLSGLLQSGANVNVQVSVEQRQAMDAHSVARSMPIRDVVAEAERLLASLLGAEDAHAVAAVGRLMRMLPSAEAQ